MLISPTAVALWAVLAAQPNTAEPQILAQPDADAALARIQETALTKTVHDLVGLGARMGGTASGDRAAIYLAGEFLKAGLDVRVFSDPLQWAHEEIAFGVTAYGPNESFELEHAWPYGYSPTKSGRVPLSLDVAPGVAALRERQDRRRVADDKQADVILIDGNTTLDGTWPRINHLRAGDKETAPVFGINQAEGARLRAGLAAGEAWEIDYHIVSIIQRAAPKTVEARIAAAPGAEPGFLLFCAHGDSDAGGPGANDNGSGVAIVLEIARAWQAAIDAGALPPPAREVRFAIWGSEIASTSAYLKDLIARGETILGVINYDQAGFGSGAEQLNIEPDDLPANQALVLSLVDLLKEKQGKDGFPERFATNKSLGGTDSYVFSSSKLFKENGLPAVTVFTSAWDKPEEHPRTKDMPGESWSDRDLVNVDYDNFYHSAGDTPENTTDLEPWNMGWCARVGLAGGLRWLDALE
jgi:hypothetical protein